MNFRICLLAAALAFPTLHASPLSEADREALIEKLDGLRDTAQAKAMGRIGSAASAFKAGMASDDAAVDLYLKCVEKVDFKDKDRSSQDFRDWKRRQGDRLKNPEIRRAMRHQIRWLHLTLEAAENEGKFEKLAPKAADILEGIFGNPEQFGDRVDILRENVQGTVFARAYNLGGVTIEKWPLAPLQVSEIFDRVILPDLRAKKKFDSMREQWKRRITYEGISAENWIPAGDRKGEADRVAESNRFTSEKIFELQWEMQMDLFKSGDQKVAALGMLKHIESNLGHAKARTWAEQFRQLVDPKKQAPATAAQ